MSQYEDGGYNRDKGMNEIIISENLVRQLITDQFPTWQNLQIKEVEKSGHDNRTFRLGDTMCVRLPSALSYASQVEKEFEWLPKLAPHISLSITEPLALGTPNTDYPYSQSINKYLEGETLQLSDNNKSDVAKELANFLKELESIDATNGPLAGTHNFYRGGQLSVYHYEVVDALEKLKAVLDVDSCCSIWEIALSSKWNKEDVWVHGDIAIGNLLHKNYHLTGVIDFGILGVGDPACDLVMAWTYFDDSSRKIFMQEMNLDSSTWDRARGWALWKALITYDNETSKNVVEILISEYKSIR